MPHRLVLAPLLLCAMSAAASGQDADMQAFTSFKAAEALDDKCHYFKHFERTKFGEIEKQLLAPLPFFGAHEAGKLTDDQYWDQYDVYYDTARDTAAGIDCADNARAGALILPLRNEIARRIYADLMIAHQSGKLVTEQQQAATAFENMIAPLYGEANWPRFVEAAGQTAQSLVDDAKARDMGYDPLNLGGLGGTGGLLGGDDLYDLYAFEGSTAYVDTLIQNAVDFTDKILFEVIAEQHGYRRIATYSTDGEGWFRDQLMSKSLEPAMDLLDLPGRYEALGMGARFSAVFVVTAAGAARLMTYGEGAERMRTGHVIFLVKPATEGAPATSFDTIRSQEWWDTAQRFQSVPVEETCLGGPCFAIPIELVNLLETGPSGLQYRYYFTDRPEGFETVPDDPRVHSGWNYRALDRQKMLAAGL